MSGKFVTFGLFWFADNYKRHYKMHMLKSQEVPLTL